MSYLVNRVHSVYKQMFEDKKAVNREKQASKWLNDKE